MINLKSVNNFSFLFLTNTTRSTINLFQSLLFLLGCFMFFHLFSSLLLTFLAQFLFSPVILMSLFLSLSPLFSLSLSHVSKEVNKDFPRKWISGDEGVLAIPPPPPNRNMYSFVLSNANIIPIFTLSYIGVFLHLLQHEFNFVRRWPFFNRTSMQYFARIVWVSNTSRSRTVRRIFFHFSPNIHIYTTIFFSEYAQFQPSFSLEND